MYSQAKRMSCFTGLQITCVMYNRSHYVECTHIPLPFINPYFSPEDIFIYLDMCNQVKRERMNDKWLIIA